MSTDSDAVQGICTKFNDIHWHDSQLVGLQIGPAGAEQYDISFDLRLLTNSQPGHDELTAARLEIQDCRIIELSVDTLGIRLTGGDIATAFCEAGPGLVSKLENRAFDLPQGEAPFKDIIHFTIRLIPPGGEINVFARNFFASTSSFLNEMVQRLNCGSITSYSPMTSMTNGSPMIVETAFVLLFFH